MYSRKNDDIITCPHCGTASLRVSEAWINGMGDGEPLPCPNCKKSLSDNQSSGDSGSGIKAKRSFNISFFVIVFLLSGLMIYLNRTMEEIGASVNEAEIRNSLLGMTFFKRLKSYEVKNDVLTLYWSK